MWAETGQNGYNYSTNVTTLSGNITASGLTKLREEDPTFEVRHEPQLSQTLLVAQGELQIVDVTTGHERIIRDRDLISGVPPTWRPVPGMS